MSVITLAGESLQAQLVSQGQPLVINKMVFAKIDGISPSDTIDRAEGMPESHEIKDILPITSAGVVNSNTVVYSTVMGSDVGTYEFNWIGLYCEEHETIVAIAYVPLQEKRATTGPVLGNILTKNFATEYNGAAEVTGITINAESWQIDYTARLNAMDLNARNTAKRIWGDAVFYGDGFKVEHDGSGWILRAGKALAGGLILELEGDMIFMPDQAAPTNAYLDIYQKATMAGIENKFKLVTATEQPSDYTQNGETHEYVLIAEITGETTSTDKRQIAPLNFKLIDGCLALEF